MQCVEFSRKFHRLLDERQQPEDDAALQDHALKCPDCRVLLLGQMRLTEILAQEISIPGPDFTLHTLRMVTGDQPVRRSKPWGFAVAIVIAATLLIAAMPLTQRWHEAKRSRVARLEERSREQARTRQPQLGTIASFRPGNVAPGLEHPPLAAATAAEQEEFRRWFRDILSNIPEVPDEQLEPIDRGIRPLKSTLGKAIDALCRTILVARDPVPVEPQAHSPAATRIGSVS